MTKPKAPWEDIKEIRLESIRFFTEAMLSKDLLLGYKHELNILIEPICHNLIFHLESRIWGQQLKNRVFKYPLDWWEAVKERFAPAWFLKKYPVKYKTIDIDAKLLYPNLQIQVPNEQYVVCMQAYEKPY